MVVYNYPEVGALFASLRVSEAHFPLDLPPLHFWM